jgi:hypothetical protein
MNNAKPALYQDKLFRRIATGSSGLGFAAMMGWLASLNLSDRCTFQFSWHWSIPLWMTAAAIFNWRLWDALWHFQDGPSPKTKLRLTIFVVASIAMGLAAFLYPIRFIASEHYRDILRGLVTGAIFLGIVGGIMIAISRGLTETEPAKKEDPK